MTGEGVSPAYSTSSGARTRRTEGGGERSWGSGKRRVVSGTEEPAKAMTMTTTMLRARYDAWSRTVELLATNCFLRLLLV